MISLVWFRLDLRLADNPALAAAVKRGGPIIPVFVYAPEEEAPWAPGAASRWWLHHSLTSLEGHLRSAGSRLVIRQGASGETLQQLAKETGASVLFWNRRYEPAVVARDEAVNRTFCEAGLRAESFNAAQLHEPWTIKNQSGRPFQVFSAFWRHCLTREEPPEPLPAPKRIKAPAKWPPSLPLAELQLEPKIDWAGGLRAAWLPGEQQAERKIQAFVSEGLDGYSAQRNRPDQTGTSRLSPHLHFGEIGPRQVWHAVRRTAEKRGLPEKQWRQSQFLTELGWREFACHLLYHFPHTTTEPLRPQFRQFKWRRDAKTLSAWQKGCTGYPIVDAGMRELWTTGWMHNRVRMIVASFLVKDLLVTWQEGARWFWDTLVDADLANNTLGWQWTAGCGADAAPFFRIFNPVTQGQKFDPEGAYIRRWCPELARMPNRWIHQPHHAPRKVLEASDIEPGVTYPSPIVSHTIAREVALEAFLRLRRSAPETRPPDRI